MRVWCGNCGQYSNIAIEKGTPKDDVIDRIKCPHCGVDGQCQYR